MNASYVTRVLRMTLLAPDIDELILDGRQPDSLTLAWALAAFPVEWPGRRATRDTGPAAVEAGKRRVETLQGRETIFSRSRASLPFPTANR